MDAADELAYASIASMGPRLASGEVSAVELTQACLDRIDRLEPCLNAFITVRAEAALETAREVEREIRSGRYRGPLHGIPIAQKDLYYTAGVRTTAGSKVLADFVPDYDATVVARLRDAGTVMLGKLNMHEFAAGGTNENPHYGAAHNPWNVDYYPGGSSGGSGAALAAGLCLGATGSDTAGSIRIPSHCCGTTGIKPTYGRVSCHGVVPLSWSLDHPGPMTRSAEDAALMLTVMAGFDRRDPSSVERPAENFSAGLDTTVRGLRVGIPRTYFVDGLQPEVERAWRDAARTLESLGAIPVEVEFTQLEDAVAIGTTISRAEMTTFHREWYARQPADYSAPSRERFESMRGLSATEYIEAQRAREHVRADLWAAFDQVEVLATPTMPTTAAPIDQPPGSLGYSTRFTYPFNLSGFPALTVPCGFDEIGLPIGLQLAARPWQEALLLRVGHAFQLATDWHRRRPTLEPREH